jgi:hypothetical protein
MDVVNINKTKHSVNTISDSVACLQGICTDSVKYDHCYRITNISLEACLNFYYCNIYINIYNNDIII